MRLYNFCFALDASKGGVPNSIFETTMQLSKHGVKSNIFSSGNTKIQIERNKVLLNNLVESGIDFKYSPTRIQNDYGIGSLRKLKKTLTDVSKPDYIILHEIYTLSTLLGYLFAKKSGIPYAVYPHGSLASYHESKSRIIKRISKILIINRILLEANSIIVTCENERNELDIVLQPKVWVIPFGATIKNQNSNSNTPIRRVKNDVRIMFSGRFHVVKNLHLLIESIPEVIKFYPNLILDIAGSGTENEVLALKNLTQELKLDKHIKFHGWLDKINIDRLFNSTRMLVLPSSYENFALVVSEALSAGVPCVVSKFVGTSDIISKHHAGEIISELTPEAIAKVVIQVLTGDEHMYRAAALKAAREDLEWSKIALKWKALIMSKL